MTVYNASFLFEKIFFGFLSFFLSSLERKEKERKEREKREEKENERMFDLAWLIIFRFILVLYGYRSLKAIDSADDQSSKSKWLTFWFLFSVIYFLEYWVDTLGSWIPFYNIFKIGLVIFLGFCNGSSLVYSLVAKPIVTRYEDRIDSKLSSISSAGMGLFQKGKNLAVSAGTKAFLSSNTATAETSS